MSENKGCQLPTRTEAIFLIKQHKISNSGKFMNKMYLKIIDCNPTHKFKSEIEKFTVTIWSTV